MRVFALIVLLICGCSASTQVLQYPKLSEKQHVESKALPERPDAVAIPKEQDWSRALPASKCTDVNGVLLSPEKAARAKGWQDGYNNLRSLYEIDREVWQQHRIVYEERTAQANAEIRRLSPSWFDENKGTLAWVGGFLMGAATSVAIVYALDNIGQ